MSYKKSLSKPVVINVVIDGCCVGVSIETVYYLFITFQYSYPSHGGFLAGVVRQNKTIKSGLQAYGLKQTHGCEID